MEVAPSAFHLITLLSANYLFVDALQQRFSKMPVFPTRSSPSLPSLSTGTNTMNEEARPMPNQRMSIVTPGSDITIHVEEKRPDQEETSQIATASQKTLHKSVTSTLETEKSPVTNTTLGVTPRETMKSKQLSTAPAIRTNMSFRTIYASHSCAVETTATPLLESRTVYQTPAVTYDLISPVQVQQAKPTSAVMVDSQALASKILLYTVIALLALLIAFAIKVYLIVVHERSFAFWKPFIARKDPIAEDTEKQKSQTDSLGVFTFSTSRPNSLYEMQLPANLVTSPPQTPKPTPLQAITSSARSTPAEAMFSSTLRHRQSSGKPSLRISPPAPRDLDLENQAPLATPTRAYFRPAPPNFGTGASVSAREGSGSLLRGGNAGLVAGAVNWVTEWMVRYTRGVDGEEFLLP